MPFPKRPLFGGFTVAIYQAHCVSITSLYHSPILQLSVNRDGENKQTILQAFYLPLNPAHCMCETFPPFFEDGYCDSYTYNCINYEVHCENEGSGSGENNFIVRQIDMDQCASPPSITLTVAVNGEVHSVVVNGNKTEVLRSSRTLLMITV